MIYPTTLIAASSLPSSVDEVWAPAQLFRANWEDSIKLESEFSTIIRSSKSASEDRMSLLNRPYRTLSVDIMAKTRNETLLLHDFILRTAHAGYLLPLYCDQTVLENDFPSASLTCDTRYRRFHEGGRIALLHPSNLVFELGVISSVSDSSITLSESLTIPFASGSLIYPIMECRTDISLNDAKHFTDTAGSASIKAQERLGKMSLPALTSEVTEYPLWNIPFNWNKELSWSPFRTGEYESMGKDKVLRAYGSRARHAYSMKQTYVTRERAWALISFFNHRKGKTKAFWFPSPASEFTYVSHTTNTIKVTSVGQLSDWEFRPAIAIQDQNGTVYVRQITQVVRGTGDTLVLSSSLPTLTGGVPAAVRLCTLARFDQNELEEKWESTEVMSTKFKIVELLEEKSVDSNIKPIIEELL